MTTMDHAHPIDAGRVEAARVAGLSPADAGRLSELLTVLSDPIRVRQLFALMAVGELCVGDLALALDVTSDQSSYALKQLRQAGLVQSRRAGRVIYYRLVDGFPHQLLEHCLHQLIFLADKEHPS